MPKKGGRLTKCRYCNEEGLVWGKNSLGNWKLYPPIDKYARPPIADLNGVRHKCGGKSLLVPGPIVPTLNPTLQEHKLNLEYFPGDIVTWDGKQWRCKEAHSYNGTRPSQQDVEHCRRIWELVETVPQSTPYTSTPQSGESTNMTDLEKALAAAVSPYLKQTVDEEKVRAIVKAELASAPAIQDHSTRVLQIELTSPSAPVITIPKAHKQVPELLYWVNQREPVMLFGKPGTGKSHSAHQVSEAINLSFWLISLNPQTPESRLFGYKDAVGNYHHTGFRSAYENGGVVCIDEIDNASDSLLTSLNSALSNGHGCFPDAMVKRHPDFVLIATANTPGRGGDINHAGRRPLDAATIDRFAIIEWDYDLDLEKSLVNDINPNAMDWFEYVVRTREHCRVNHPRVIVSPRASYKGALALKNSGFSIEQIADSVLFKGLDKDTKAKILSAVPLPITV